MGILRAHLAATGCNGLIVERASVNYHDASNFRLFAEAFIYGIYGTTYDTYIHNTDIQTRSPFYTSMWGSLRLAPIIPHESIMGCIISFIETLADTFACHHLYEIQLECLDEGYLLGRQGFIYWGGGGGGGGRGGKLPPQTV